jgi:hypothetical protein
LESEATRARTASPAAGNEVGAAKNIKAMKARLIFVIPVAVYQFREEAELLAIKYGDVFHDGRSPSDTDYHGAAQPQPI